MFDYDRDTSPDLLVANDTRPNKLYRNSAMAPSKMLLSKPDSAFSEGKAPAWASTLQILKIPAPLEWLSLISITRWLDCWVRGFADIATQSGVGLASKDRLELVRFRPNLDGRLDLAVANGHIDESLVHIRGNVGYAQPPQLF